MNKSGICCSQMQGTQGYQIDQHRCTNPNAAVFRIFPLFLLELNLNGVSESYTPCLSGHSAETKARALFEAQPIEASSPACHSMRSIRPGHPKHGARIEGLTMCGS